MQAMVQRTNLHRAASQPAQRGRECRLPDSPVDGIGDHEDVGGQFVIVPLQQLWEGWRPDLLLALDEHRDTDRRLSAERPQRSEMSREAARVVGYAAAVESPVVLSCDKGRSTPVGRVPLGLDVV